jgi:nucleoid-associated protein
MPIEAENNTVVKNVVVHRLLKQDDGFHASLRDNPNEVSDTTKKAVNLLIKEYAKRAGKAHGQFEADEDNYPVQGYLRRHFADKSTDFVTMTSSMMTTLCAKAKGKAATPGGVIFAHTQTGEAEHMIVAIVTEEWGVALRAGLEVEGDEYLDLKGFRFAGRVNITEWLDNGDKYLSFLKGKGHEVSEYFKSFLGCANSVTYYADTKGLKDALDEFAEQSNLNEAQRRSFFDKAYEICARHQKSHTPLELETFANELWPNAPDALTAIFGNPERKLSDGFVPDKRIINGFIKFSGKTDNWKLEFSREAIQKQEIFFDEDDETLTIKNLPLELKERLRREKPDNDE